MEVELLKGCQFEDRLVGDERVGDDNTQLLRI